MTDRERLVEAVARELCRDNPFRPADRLVRAALQAIHDAGYRIVPVEPSEDRVRAGIDLAMRVTLGGEYRWADYMRDLYRTMTEGD